MRLRSIEDLLFYNPLIRITQLSAIKANIAALLVFKLLSEKPAQMAAAVLIYLFINVLPLVYVCILYKHDKSLEDEEVKRKYFNLYDNKNVDRNRTHRVWFFPLSFFYRRTVFCAVTIFLYDMPDM